LGTKVIALSRPFGRGVGAKTHRGLAPGILLALTRGKRSDMWTASKMIPVQLIEAVPFSHALGMVLVHAHRGEAELSMPYDERIVGDPETGVIHGGAVSALLDTCCGVAVMSHPEGSFMTATLDLRIDYMRPATPGQRIVARAECYHVTRTAAFVRAQALDDDTSRPVATAAAAFTLDNAENGKRGAS